MAATATQVRSNGPAKMELRKFVAPTMAECLSRVKSEMGAGAVILSTRTVQQKRLLGLLKREHVEITAGSGLRTVSRRRPSVARPPARPTLQARQLLQVAGSLGHEHSDLPAGTRATPGRDLLNTPAAASAAYLGVSQEIGDLKQMVTDLVTQFRHSQTPDIPEPLFAFYRCLRDQQVCEETARAIAMAVRERISTDQTRDQGQLARLCRDELEKHLPTGGAIHKAAKGRPQIVALIGPTGVGKTTTIAKLAANLKLRENKKVGLITIDTYRIAAIDQLKKYAEIINAPVAVVSSPGEIKDAVARMGDCDFVLIDTAGRSPKDAVKLKELKAFLEAARPDEVHLVLSAVCGYESTRLALQRFSGVRADRVIFTKLDEAAEMGVVLNVTASTRLPISYITNGQDVPNDIETASASKLSQMLLERVN